LIGASKAIEIASVGREGAIGMSAHSGAWQAHAGAIVQVPGSAKAIPAELLKDAMARSEHIRDVMMRYLDTLWAQTQQLAACNALHSVEQRLARWLLQIWDRIGSAEISATQNTMANQIGAQRTTVTLLAHRFQQDGLIRYRRARITITNPTALCALACECYESRK
jgi:CRP-like cAMP-binding protein